MFEIIVSCFLPLLRLFLQLGLGYLSYKFKWLGKDTAKEFSGYCMNVLLPLYLVGQLAHDVNPSKLGYFIPTLANFLLLMGTGYTVSVILFKKLPIPVHLHNPLRASLMFSNNFLFPIMVMNGMCQSYGFLYGDPHCNDADFYTVCYIPIANAIIWTYGLNLFKSAQKVKQASLAAQSNSQPLIALEDLGQQIPQAILEERVSPKQELEETESLFSYEQIKKLLSNVCNTGFIATVIGMVLGLMPFTKPLFLDEKAPFKVFMDAIMILGGVCIPIINIIIGYNMGLQSETLAQSSFRRKDQFIILGIKFVGTPFLGIFLMKFQQVIFPTLYENVIFSIHSLLYSHCPCSKNAVLVYNSYLQWTSPTASVIMLFSIVTDVGAQEVALLLYYQMLVALPAITFNSTLFLALS